MALVLVFSSIIGQTKAKYSNRVYKRNPMWIKMMNDTNANYFETLKAFKLFWKEKELPHEEMEKPGEDWLEKELGMEEKNEKEHEVKKKTKIDYSNEVRAFKGWIQSNKDWIRQDGSIISEYQRQAIINGQQNELKQIEKQNGKK